MERQKKLKVKWGVGEYLLLTMVLIFFPIGIVVNVDAFTNPSLTRTELILRLPQSLRWDFSMEPKD